MVLFVEFMLKNVELMVVSFMLVELMMVEPTNLLEFTVLFTMLEFETDELEMVLESMVELITESLMIYERFIVDLLTFELRIVELSISDVSILLLLADEFVRLLETILSSS